MILKTYHLYLKYKQAASVYACERMTIMAMTEEECPDKVGAECSRSSSIVAALTTAWYLVDTDILMHYAYLVFLVVSAAPEVLRGKVYDSGVDLWAVGVIAYIM